MQECMLSVYCMAFNHGPYIRKTLEGFVNQVTDYKYEVIVHDDASTDNTAEIIREFEEKYPDIIKPIYQKENQYSQRIDIFDNHIGPRLRGKYIAVCEGDDYWCDNQKIQLQLDYLESHPECSLCVHNSIRINADGEDLHNNFNNSEKDLDYTAKEVIEADGGGLFHTSAFMYKKEDRLNIPADFTIKGVGDFPMAIYLSVIGQVHYIGRIMSAYRMDAVGSWTSKQKKNVLSQWRHYTNVVEGLGTMKKYSIAHLDGKYADSYDVMIHKYKYRKALLQGNVKEVLKNPNLRPFYDALPGSEKLKIRVKKMLSKVGAYKYGEFPEA